jgi:uncharacterized membrane protein YjdF
MYNLKLVHNNGSQKEYSFYTQKEVIGFLYNSMSIYDCFIAEEVPIFFADQESQEIYGIAKNVYNPFDDDAHYYNGDYVYRVELNS